jgi:CP family cyanate transporter-like MFS transporter
VAEGTAGGVALGGTLTRRDWVQLALLWLGGFDLRVTLLAVPPVIPAIHRQLGLDEKGVSILTGLPVLLLAVAAVPGAVLIARLGARRALVLGLGGIALAAALRGVGPNLAVLFAMTLLMGVGVAISQPAFPTLTREWFPLRVGLATAVYSNGLLVGETVPASLTGPLVLPALGDSWPLSFAFWALPVAGTAVLMLRFTAHLPLAPGAPQRWWPAFRNPAIWRVGLVMGCASASYFGTNAFLPDFVHATGRPEFKDAALAATNVGQLPASFLVLALPDRFVGHRWPFVASGGVIAAAAVLLVLTPGAWVVAWAGVIGFAAAIALVLTLALPPLLAAPGDVHRFSAGIFLIIYGLSFAGPLVGGAAWDATRRPAAAFLTLAALGGLMVALALSLAVRPARD